MSSPSSLRLVYYWLSDLSVRLHSEIVLLPVAILSHEASCQPPLELVLPPLILEHLLQAGIEGLKVRVLSAQLHHVLYPVMISVQVHHGLVDHVTHLLLEKEVSLVCVTLLFLRFELLPEALHVLFSVPLHGAASLGSIFSRGMEVCVVHFQISS